MNKYEIILNVCDTKSISKTAEKLNYTQSAISQTIKSYEKELGMRLFNRSKKGMELRSDAEDIIASLRNICREERHIAELAASMSDLEKGDLRIGTIQSISYTCLPTILLRFSEAYPNINFTLTIADFPELNKQLESNRLDCIFTSEYASPDIPFFPLWKDELMLVMPKSHHLADQISVAIEEIDGEPYLLSADGMEYEAGEILRMNGITPNVRYRLNDDFTVVNLIEYGYGVSILSRLLLSKTPFDVCVRPFKAHYYRTLGIAYPEKEKQPHALRQFLESIKDWKESAK